MKVIKNFYLRRVTNQVDSINFRYSGYYALIYGKEVKKGKENSQFARA